MRHPEGAVGAVTLRRGEGEGSERFHVFLPPGRIVRPHGGPRWRAVDDGQHPNPIASGVADHLVVVAPVVAGRRVRLHPPPDQIDAEGADPDCTHAGGLSRAGVLYGRHPVEASRRRARAGEQATSGRRTGIRGLRTDEEGQEDKRGKQGPSRRSRRLPAPPVRLWARMAHRVRAGCTRSTEALVSPIRKRYVKTTSRVSSLRRAAGQADEGIPGGLRSVALREQAGVVEPDPAR